MAIAPRQPAGNDPRLKLGSDDLQAASAVTYPQVAGKAGRFDFGLLAIVAAALGIGAVTWISLTSHRTAPPAVPAHAAAASPNLSVAHATPAAVTPVPVSPAAIQGGPLTLRPAATLPAASDPRTPAMIIDNSAPAADGGAAKAAGGSGEGLASLLDPNEKFAARIGANGENTASHISDPAHTIPQGTVIPAVLETALDSDLPGFARAIVSRDIRGFDGSIVLVPRGSRLIGQYKSNLSSGVKRMYVIWERVLRPDGVSIQLGSPATDEIGRTGLAGEVETHFLKRFGAAMLLSVVSGLATSNSGTAIVIGSAGGAQTAASDALGVDARIPPTVTVEQGSVIQVFVAHDLHFGE
jgi:type IV secretion system protein VirB10